ncbi:MAG: hypothetical protein CMK50_05085 [Propionibacteriaceae bacterium]|nr:hypothetical protein [Propionibacteriaceae bacterium]MBT67694.1 hypothetical protein [Synechococcus sp. NP17]
MGASSQNIEQQLSHQLHLVSEIAESLTLRLLTLEERINLLSSRQDSVEPELPDDSESLELLSDSNDRLVQLRGLLNEGLLNDTPVLEVVTNDSGNEGLFVDEFANLDNQQTIYVNDSQELPSDVNDQVNDEIIHECDDLLSA